MPAAQSVHNAVPVPGLYFPAAHGANAPPFGPVYPALAEQAASAELPLGEDEPAAQSTQWNKAKLSMSSNSDTVVRKKNSKRVSLKHLNTSVTSHVQTLTNKKRNKFTEYTSIVCLV